MFQQELTVKGLNAKFDIHLQNVEPTFYTDQRGK